MLKTGRWLIVSREGNIYYCVNNTKLTLKVWGPSYLGLTRSISWLLMPWLLTSPGHQQPWYWLCSMCRSWSYLRKDVKYLCHINVQQWYQMHIYVYVPSAKISTLRVKIAACKPNYMLLMLYSGDIKMMLYCHWIIKKYSENYGIYTST